MLRAAVQQGSSLGMTAKAIMEAGQLVDDKLVTAIVVDAIQKSPLCNTNGFILDGFPRTVEQACMLDEQLTAASSDGNDAGIDCVINLLVDDELLIKRITGRLIHPASGRSYNIYLNPPKVDGIDDITGEPLVKRGDDTEEKLRTRLTEFHNKTEPVLQHYRDKVVNVPADGDMNTISKAVIDALKEVKGKKIDGKSKSTVVKASPRK